MLIVQLYHFKYNSPLLLINAIIRVLYINSKSYFKESKNTEKCVIFMKIRMENLSALRMRLRLLASLHPQTPASKL